MTPEYGTVYQVTFQKSRPTSARGYETEFESVSVLADDIERALELGKQYIELIPAGEFHYYKIVGLEQSFEVFLGVEGDMEIIFTPDTGIFSGELPKNWKKSHEYDPEEGV